MGTGSGYVHRAGRPRQRLGAILVAMSLALAALPMAAGAVVVTPVDLSVTKVAAPITESGQPAYTIRVTNNNVDGQEATDVRVTDSATFIPEDGSSSNLEILLVPTTCLGSDDSRPPSGSMYREEPTWG